IGLLSKNRVLPVIGVIIDCLAILAFNYVNAGLTGINIAMFSGFKPGGIFPAIGFSFYVLQQIAYLTDLRKGKFPPERNFIDFLLVSVFFPKLISGPIVLYQELKPQLQRQRPSAEMMFGGFNRFFYGILKKVLLADRLAPAVRSVFDHNDQYPGITILAGAVI